jgi:uncharacterized protein YbjT (DUF2867 family)
MTSKVVVAGATGNLGGRVVRSLIERGATVGALVRAESKAETIRDLAARGVETITVDLADQSAVIQALAGAQVLVSVLQGLGDVIVGTQTRLVQAAIEARVPRFIPSDYAADFTKLDDAENRNFGYRREFHRYLDSAPISTTSVLNGMFMDILLYGMPLLDFKARSVSYWGDADQLLDFTTMNDVAAYTAAAALDDAAPAVLRVAGDQQSPRQLAELATEFLGETFTLRYMGTTEEMAATIQSVRTANPESETEEFPRFQQMQYLHNMFTGRAKLSPLDNDRYTGMNWTKVRDLLAHRAR